MKLTEQNDHVVIGSGLLDDASCVLSVLVKRTYALDPKRGVVVADKQLPLQPLLIDEDEPEQVLQESDIYPVKELTDIIVRGHVHPSAPARQTTASVSVGPLTKALLVHGDRRCSRDAHGRLRFGEPARFDKMPLTSAHAYGGTNQVALAKYGNPYTEWMKYARRIAQKSRHNPYRYPRNGVGKGYLYEATDEALEALELPNLEDPSDPLSPTRLAVGKSSAWPTMPLPWFTDWLSLGAFPRTAYYGAAPEFDIEPDQFAEVARRFMPSGIIRKGFKVEPCKVRVANAGSLGLQLLQLTGATVSELEFRLENLHPTLRTAAFRLPAGAPDIWVDGRGGDGKLVQTKPVLHHVVIEPDADRVSVLWRGSTPVLRRYAHEEMERMPLSVTWPVD